MTHLWSASYSLSGVATTQHFPNPGVTGVPSGAHIRIHNIGIQLNSFGVADSVYWDVFNAPLMTGHLGHLRYTQAGSVVSISGPIDLPSGAYLGFTYNGTDAGTICTAWAIYEIVNDLGDSVPFKSPAPCSWLDRLLMRC